LLIGINYTGSKVALKGCINDVINIKKLLMANGFPDIPEAMTVLTDEPNSKMKPTRKTIIQAIGWLVKDLQPGDHLFLHYSGHGGLKEDPTGKEETGYDQTILPCDYATAGEIIDNDLYDMVVKPLKKGVQLIALFDSCHSGTVLDLPFTYRSNGEYKTGSDANVNPFDKASLGKAFMKAGVAFMKGDKEAFKSFGTSVFEGAKCSLMMKENKVDEANISPADVIQMAGCQDDQTSADTSIAGSATGAMSYALVSAVTKHGNGNLTLIELLHAVRKCMEEKQFTQVPQISTAHKMDPQTKFSL